MRDTRFLDRTGLNPGNVSTAQDLAMMVNAGYHYPLIRDFTTSDSDRHRGCAPATHRWRFRNSNGLVRSGHWEIGLSKTGYISEAGRCLVMQATHRGQAGNHRVARLVGQADRVLPMPTASSAGSRRWNPPPLPPPRKPRMG